MPLVVTFLILWLSRVGKSSLAQTAAFSLAEGSDPIIVACDDKSTFGTIRRTL